MINSENAPMVVKAGQLKKMMGLGLRIMDLTMKMTVEVMQTSLGLKIGKEDNITERTVNTTNGGKIRTCIILTDRKISINSCSKI